MSKRDSNTQKNTILKYFSPAKPERSVVKSEEAPPVGQDAEMEEISDDTPTASTSLGLKRSLESDDLEIADHSYEDFEASPCGRRVKRLKRVKKIRDDTDSSDSEDEKINNILHSLPAKFERFGYNSPVATSSASSFANKDVDETPNSGRDDSEKENESQDVSSTTISKSSGVNGNQSKKNMLPNSSNTFFHHKLDFLQPGKVRDKNKILRHEPNYDHRTLYVPESFLNEQTPAMRQWWIMKSNHLDCLIFFKVGRFYELYHMDAVISAVELGISYMKGDFAHTGFPEISYENMARRLIGKGYKVARTEQTETPEMMLERCKKLPRSTKFDKVVNREICQISSKGSLISNALLTETAASSNYMFAIAVKFINPHTIRFGVCFVDTTIGLFKLGEFDDNIKYSRLLAMFAENPPQLVLLEHKFFSSALIKLINMYYTNVRKEILSLETQFYNASKTIEKLKTDGYFLDENGELILPEFIKNLINDIDSAKPEYELAVKALGACMWYLKYSQIDIQVLSMGKFEFYSPPDLVKGQSHNSIKNMILDSFTIHNLNLLEGVDSLYKTIDFCQTAFGKRLLKQWICRPSCIITEITQRQDAIKELHQNPSILSSLQKLLQELPDLERQVAKIHAYGNKLIAITHPDSRANFCEGNAYSIRRTKDLLNTLKGFELSQEIPSLFKDSESYLLKKMTQFSPNGIYVDLSEVLIFFKNAFDQSEAETKGTIIPGVGLCDEYDAALNRIEAINNELHEYLTELKRKFSKDVKYFGTDKKRFQIEIPNSVTRKVPDEYRLESTRKGPKGCKRYSTPRTTDLLNQMKKAEEQRDKVAKDLNRCIFESFSKKYEKWNQVIYCLSVLDVLSSLAQYGKNTSYDICLPEVKPFCNASEFVTENGRHPCLLNLIDFVPNDVKMGINDYPSTMLLTGPNMGGKSTLMRQVALIAIMAQIGSYVPASYCRVNLIDRIFCRFGAYDDIIKGQSTFLVELNEASSVLKQVTTSSLLLLDELGRGTSTHDGNAIAVGYIQKLIEYKCRALFSTHYFSLIDKFIDIPDIQLGYMKSIVENEDDPENESITFLYKLDKGRCPKSYGFNVAVLAGLKRKTVARARKVAKEFENENANRNLFSELFTLDEFEDSKSPNFN